MESIDSMSPENRESAVLKLSSDECYFGDCPACGFPIALTRRQANHDKWSEFLRCPGCLKTYSMHADDASCELRETTAKNIVVQRVEIVAALSNTHAGLIDLIAPSIQQLDEKINEIAPSIQHLDGKFNKIAPSIKQLDEKLNEAIEIIKGVDKHVTNLSLGLTQEYNKLASQAARETKDALKDRFNNLEINIVDLRRSVDKAREGIRQLAEETEAIRERKTHDDFDAIANNLPASIETGKILDRLNSFTPTLQRLEQAFAHVMPVRHKLEAIHQTLLTPTPVSNSKTPFVVESKPPTPIDYGEIGSKLTEALLAPETITHFAAQVAAFRFANLNEEHDRVAQDIPHLLDYLEDEQYSWKYADRSDCPPEAKQEVLNVLANLIGANAAWFQQHGILRFGLPGDRYDLALHEKFESHETNDEAAFDTVKETMRSGYRLAKSKQVLRRARVVVWVKPKPPRSS